MPIYCYSHKGTVVERMFRMGEAPKAIMVDDKKYERDIGAEHVKPQPVGDLWPLLSDAAGVHPDQIPTMAAEARKRGVPTDYTPDGRVVFRDPHHRRDYLKAFGMHDRASYC
jgi:hypothetical protein